MQQKSEITERLSEIRSAVQPIRQNALIAASGIGACTGIAAGATSPDIDLIPGLISGGILGGILGFATVRAGAIYASGSNGARYAVIGSAALAVTTTIGVNALSTGCLVLVGAGTAIFGYLQGGDLYSEAEVDRRVTDLQAKTSAERERHIARLARLKEQVMDELEELTLAFPENAGDLAPLKSALPAE